MTTMSEMLRKPIEIEIAGRRLKAVPPDIDAIYAENESAIIATEIAQIRQMADAERLQGSQRTAYLAEARQYIPKGRKLAAMVWESIGTRKGITSIIMAGIRQNNPAITDQELSGMVTADPEGADAAASELCGLPKNQQRNTATPDEKKP
jgi:hypothetical protein